MVRTLALTVAALVLVACGGNDDSDLDAARSILRDRDRFDTGVEAGDAFAEVAVRLLEDARACDDDCDVRFSAAAYARVLAVRVLGCTAPGRERARAGMLAHVEAIGDGEEAPAAPPDPACPLTGD